MRHGRPILAQSRWHPPNEMQAWLAHYDQAEVEASNAPADSMALGASATHVVASDLPRALSSVRALGLNASVVDAIYREAQLPLLGWGFPRLPAAMWTVLLRVLWMMGYAAQAESLCAARARARRAALRLIALAESGTVLLLGHGIMNRLIARELLALGWSSCARGRSSYWTAVSYRARD